MPAVIDTGGPRVLHCVERADCPIPRATPILTPSRSSYRGFTFRKRQSRLAIDAVNRCVDNVAALLGSSIDETSDIPGNDERDEFFTVQRSPSDSRTSSNDLGRLFVARGERGHRFGDRKRYDALQRRRISRRKYLCCEIHQPESSVNCLPRRRDVDEINEITLRDEVSNSAGGPINETLPQRTPSIIPKKEGSSETTTARHLTPSLRHVEPDGSEQSSDIVMRLFGGCDLEQDCETMYRRVEETSAAISSQRVLNCAEYEWQCECFSPISRGSGSMIKTESESERSTRERRKRHRPRNERKGRSYAQMALLLFLVAFGNGSIFKSNYGVFGGKVAGISAGLGALTIGTIVGAVRAVPVDLDGGVRAERSANLSHITGASRKIQMYIKNRHLQILPDGTVNGSNDDTSEYTIFQRTSVSRGQLRIQGVATCLYLCMDSCGLLYGSREYTDDCVFNETLEQHNYNTYSSVRWSTPRKSLYLGLNRRGQPRRVQAKGHNLGRLSAYARVLTQVAPPDRVEALQARMLGAHHKLRHHHNSHHHRNLQNRQQHHQNQQQEQQQQQQHQPQTICPNLPPQEKDGRDKFRCRKRKKRKKWKRRCNEGEKPGPHCGIVESHGRATTNTTVGKSQQSAGESGLPQSKRSCEGEASEELCRKQALDAPAKKRKSRIEVAKTGVATKAEKQQPKRKKDTRMRKPDEKSNSDGVASEASDPTRQRVNGPIGNSKKKRPGGASKQRTSSPVMRKRITGRPTRTTIASSKNVAVTLPLSWYPTLSSTTLPSTELSPPWERRIKTTTYSEKNSVTGSTSKESNEGGESFRKGKSQGEEVLPVIFAEGPRHETSTYGSIENHSAVISSLSNDWSVETSEEVKSEDSSIQQEDESTTMYFDEYSTLMTTMDTTPPERTEDYTRTTTQSIISSIEVISPDLTDQTDDSTSLEGSRQFDHQMRTPYERLAM